MTIDSYSLVMNAPGSALVALGRDDGRVDVVQRPTSGPWSVPVTVTSGGEQPALVLTAVNAAGDAFVGWGEYALLGAYRPHAGWSSPMVVSPDAGVEVLETTHAVVAPRGDVTVLWKQEDLPLKVRTMTVSATR